MFTLRLALRSAWRAILEFLDQAEAATLRRFRVLSENPEQYEPKLGTCPLMSSRSSVGTTQLKVIVRYQSSRYRGLHRERLVVARRSNQCRYCRTEANENRRSLP